MKNLEGCNYKIMSRYGIGGRNCPCCGPCPSHRKEFDKAVKHSERFKMKIRIRKEIITQDE